MMENNTAAIFGRRLKELREKEGFNQLQLAKLLKISRGALSYYESGQRTPNIDFLLTVAHFFKVSTDYLLGETDCTQPENVDICAKTGLSEAAINGLISLSQTEYIGKTMLNALLEEWDTCSRRADLEIGDATLLHMAYFFKQPDIFHDKMLSEMLPEQQEMLNRWLIEIIEDCGKESAECAHMLSKQDYRAIDAIDKMYLHNIMYLLRLCRNGESAAFDSHNSMNANPILSAFRDTFYGKINKVMRFVSASEDRQ